MKLTPGFPNEKKRKKKRIACLSQESRENCVCGAKPTAVIQTRLCVIRLIYFYCENLVPK